MKLVNQTRSLAATAPWEQWLRQMAGSASIEITPRQILESDHLDALLLPATRVYVPFLPKAEYAPIIAACHKLDQLGFTPVPHFPARAMESRSQAIERLDAITEAGAHDLMLIAGDSERQAGPYKDTLDILDAGILNAYPKLRLGVAGHPEGHTMATAQCLSDAMLIKQEYAHSTGTEMWVTTQFTFEANALLRWFEQVAPVIAPIPIVFGIAGPTSISSLIAYAARCGVGVSARALKKRPAATRLLRAWTPDGLTRSIARHFAEKPHPSFQGIHLFPFGGLRQSATWLAAHRTGAEPNLNPEAGLRGG